MAVQLGPQDLGKIDIQYRRVPCTPPIDMIVDVDGNHGAGYWLRMNVQEVSLLPVLNSVQCASFKACVSLGHHNRDWQLLHEGVEIE